MHIDVIIPVYRQAHLLPTAVASADGQDVPVHIVVVDDGNTPPIEKTGVAEWDSTQRIRVVRRDANGGIGAARNTGLAQCDGDAVIFLDADDELQPAALGRLADAMVEHEADAVFGFVEEFGVDLPPSREAKAADEPVMLPGSTLLRRSSVESLGHFDEWLGVGEFIDFMARARRRQWKIVQVNTPVLRRRLHAGNTSRLGDSSDFLRVVRRHLHAGGGASGAP